MRYYYQDLGRLLLASPEPCPLLGDCILNALIWKHIKCTDLKVCIMRGFWRTVYIWMLFMCSLWRNITKLPLFFILFKCQQYPFFKMRYGCDLCDVFGKVTCRFLEKKHFFQKLASLRSISWSSDRLDLDSGNSLFQPACQCWHN